MKSKLSLSEALGFAKRPKQINVHDLRKIITHELKILDEQTSATVNKKVASKVEKEIPPLSAGPGTMKDFLNGPGADARVRAVLNAGRLDGSTEDEEAAPEETSVLIGDMFPTQLDIDLTKSIAFPLSNFEKMREMIKPGVQRIGPAGNDTIVTNGNIIVDGHHRWSSLFSVAGPEGQIAAYDLNIPEKDAAQVLATTQVGIAATLRKGEKVPNAKVSKGTNILGKDKESIADLIRKFVGKSTEAGICLSDDYVNAVIKDKSTSSHFGITAGSSVEDARNAIIEKVSDNLSQMNQPATGSPERTDMPQLDKAAGGVKAVINKLGTGKVNYKKPITPAGEESNVQTERWQRLAGLIKD